jgi:hypothetical protein
LRSLVWLCLVIAGAATGVIGTLVFTRRPEPPIEVPVEERPAEPAPPPPAEETLRPYETTATLAEDLRDALAGPPEALGAETRRVSSRLEAKARSVLLTTAPAEASPRVRALLVLAAGAHVPDEPVLLVFLGDREPVVRRAAALAASQLEGGSAVALLPGVEVPVGRKLPAATRRALEARLAREEDGGVRGTLSAALGSPQNRRIAEPEKKQGQDPVR